MRDEIVCCIILFALIGLFVYNSYVVEDNTKDVIEAIEKAEESGKDYEDILTRWKKEKKALFYICSHTIIMQIDENINLGCEYVKLGDSERSEYMFKKARVLLEDLAQREKIKLDNIF